MSLDLVWVRDMVLTLAALTVASGVLWQRYGKPVQRWFQALDRTVQRVEEQLRINGDEPLLPLPMRGLPLRTLVINHIVSNAEAHAAQSAQASPAAATTEAVVVAAALLATATEAAKELLATAKAAAEKKEQ